MQVACTLTMIKEESAYYPACSLQYNGRPCNKKLTNSDNDGATWWCDRCQQQAQPDWRYILALQVEDHTDSLWLTAFQVATLLVEHSENTCAVKSKFVSAPATAN